MCAVSSYSVTSTIALLISILSFSFAPKSNVLLASLVLNYIGHTIKNVLRLLPCISIRTLEVTTLPQDLVQHKDNFFSAVSMLNLAISTLNIILLQLMMIIDRW